MEVDTGTPETALAATPKSCGTSSGIKWIAGGWSLFKLAPGVWVATILLFLMGWLLLSLIPLVSLALQLLLPIITAGLLLGCRDLDRGADLRIEHLGAGFGDRIKALLGAGLLYSGLTLAVFAVLALIGVLLGLGSADLASPETALSPPLLFLFLFGMLMFVPIVMGFYFSPCLLVMHSDLGVVDAFKLSLRGSIANVVPFFVYSILIGFLSLIALIPFGLGYLVLGPLLIGANYCAYKDIFLED